MKEWWGRMTKKEAIETLRANYPDACFEQLREAVDMAIEALSESKTGEWVEIENGEYLCSNCSYEKIFNYCPICGKKLKA